MLPGTLGAIKQSFLPAGGLVAEQQSSAGEAAAAGSPTSARRCASGSTQPLVGQGSARGSSTQNAGGPQANILDDQWLGTLLETGIVGFFGWLWFFVRVVRRFGAEAKKRRLRARLAARVDRCRAWPHTQSGC